MQPHSGGSEIRYPDQAGHVSLTSQLTSVLHDQKPHNNNGWADWTFIGKQHDRLCFCESLTCPACCFASPCMTRLLEVMVPAGTSRSKLREMYNELGDMGDVAQACRHTQASHTHSFCLEACRRVCITLCEVAVCSGCKHA